MTATALTVALSYPDAPAAVRWLEALGFVTLRRADDDEGRVVHCELRRGDAVVMLASDDQPYEPPPLRGASTGVGVYLVVDAAEVDALHAAALAAGAVEVIPPEDTGWGSRRARVLDPAGREWSFGSYRPGE